MKCAYHPDRDAVGACVNCGKLVCSECRTILGEKIYCGLVPISFLSLNQQHQQCLQLALEPLPLEQS
jgi:hypothetical protein